MNSFAVEVASPLPHQRHGRIAPLALSDDIVLLRGTASPRFTVTSYAALNSRQFRGYSYVFRKEIEQVTYEEAATLFR